jgi:transaldolase
MNNPLQKMVELGQSPWYDNIERKLMKSGEMAVMISEGDIRGVTSNPSIFNKAIAQTSDYDHQLNQLAQKGLSKEEIYEGLVIQDIQAATDLFMDLYESTKGGDGYVSLEVNPHLANDSEGTFQEAVRLWKAVNRPNLMVKIPATEAGLPAIRRATAAGVNVNITLIFSLTRYEKVMDAFLSGLEDRAVLGKPIDKIASVASFFVSRVDTKVDQSLSQIAETTPSQKERVEPLFGKLAIANAKLAYKRFQEVFASDRFLALKKDGARLQRPLWASTSTKNPNYADTVYVDELIGPNTVNTMPPSTLMAFKDHGTAVLSLVRGVDEAANAFSELESLGISMSQITQELEIEGVKAFADSFEELIRTIDEQRIQILTQH